MLTPRQKMAQVAYLLLTDPMGLSYSFLKKHLEVNDRALRDFIQELKDIPDLHDVDGKTRVQVSGRGKERRVALKTIDVQDSDGVGHVLSLRLAHSMLHFLKGSELEGHLRRITESFLKGPDRSLFLDLDRKIYSINEWPKDYSNKTGVLRDCLHSLLHRKKLVVRYKSPGSREAKEHELSIYTLLQYRNGLYLIAKSHKGPETMVFALERISITKKTGNQFRYPSNYSPDKYIDGAFGLIRGTANYEVEINFDPDLAEVLHSRKWHRTARITKLRNGTIKLKMSVSALDQVVPWVLGFGSLAKVLQPKELKNQIKEEIKRLRKTYKV